MGHLDHNFPGKLKNFWDMHIKHHDKLVLILCGSVSAWIQENILNATAFVGRVSLSLTLEELPLRVASQFWGKWDHKVSSDEKIRYLSVVGCIPKYLEELTPSLSTNENIYNLCFNPSGFLYDEFNKIFADVFGGRTQTYKKIIIALVDKNLTAQEIANKIELTLSSDLLHYLNDLEISGFIKKDYYFDVGMIKTKKVFYRLKDNYLRFALKYIDQTKSRTSHLKHSFKSLELLPNWKSLVGLQFENLILNHLSEVISALDIPMDQVVSASPWFQKTTTRNRGSCQIDLLIQTKDQTAFICEIKFQKVIDINIISEVEQKINKLTKKRSWSYRPILIHEGELNKNHQDELEQYFSRILKLSDLFKK
jgi:hypothetical protein